MGDGQDSVLAVQDWGRVPYAEAFDRQRALNEAVASGQASPTLVLLEHDPVVTLTRRAKANGHLLASAEHLQQLGITLHDTDRGGDITYHGPGQLVAYPILKLNDYGLNLGRYMRLLESVVMDTASAFGVQTQTVEGDTGVWGDDTHKLCAMGVRVRKNTTMHGLALNVTTDLSHFGVMVPCGLSGKSVTSLETLLGDRCPSMTEVKRVLAGCFEVALAERPAGRI